MKGDAKLSENSGRETETTMNTAHESWCHTVTGCTEPGHCTCELRENNDE